MIEKNDAFKVPGHITPKPMDPLGSVLNHMTAVVVIIGICVMLGVCAVFVKIKPYYGVDAIIQIEPVIPKMLYGKEEASILPYYDDFVRTQINIVKSFPVLSKAISDYQEIGFVWKLENESLQQSTKRLSARLVIKQLRDTQLFSLSMTARRKEGLAEIVNTVASAYLIMGREEDINKDSEKLSFLEKRKVGLKKELEKKYAVIESISAKYAFGVTDEDNISIYRHAVVDLAQQKIKATTRRIDLETRIHEFQNEVEKINKLDISPYIDEWIEDDSVKRDERVQISRRLENLRLSLEVVEKGDPDRKDYEESYERALHEQENFRIKALEEGEKIIRGKLLLELNKRAFESETNYAVALKAEEKLESELFKAEQKAATINTQILKAATLKKDVQRLQDSLHRIEERIDQLEVESRSPGRIILLTKAMIPESPSSGKRAKMAMVVALFSIVAGVGYAITRDKLDNKIRTTQDIERVLGFPVTGYVMDAKQGSGGTKGLDRIVLDNSLSIISEQYKQISFALSKDHEIHKSCIYTFLSLGERHGTTTVLINILNSLTVRKEKKILVDLNVWHPFNRDIHSSGTRQGLWEVMEGRCELKDVIIADSDEYPFCILPVGGWQERGKSFFQEMGLENMIEALRLDYEYIMLDSPPLPLSTDAKFLAQFADVVVLVLKAGQVNEKELYTYIKMLDRSGIKVISVVLNQVMILKGRHYRKSMKKYQALTTHSQGENLT